MAVHVIVGHGAVGRGAVGLLLEQGHEVRVITRSGAPPDGQVRHIRLDATDAEALTRTAHGAAVLYNCATPAYHRWAADWPPLAAAPSTRPPPRPRSASGRRRGSRC
jgi:uncharacterized protein YbjT (DUF2867 family)